MQVQIQEQGTHNTIKAQQDELCALVTSLENQCKELISKLRENITPNEREQKIKFLKEQKDLLEMVKLIIGINKELQPQPLQLNPTYIHYNSLIWQVPSAGIAIAAGVMVVAEKYFNKPIFGAAILFFGGTFLIALSIALARYRDYQATCFPINSPLENMVRPPTAKSEELTLSRFLDKLLWAKGVKANRMLQAALGSTAGGLIGLAINLLGWKPIVSFLFGIKFPGNVVTFFLLGLIWGYYFLEKGRNGVVEEIKKQTKDRMLTIEERKKKL